MFQLDFQDKYVEYEKTKMVQYAQKCLFHTHECDFSTYEYVYTAP
jgi:hypothetical protein